MRPRNRKRRFILLSLVATALGGVSCASRNPPFALRSLVVLRVGNVESHFLDDRDIETRAVSNGGPLPPGTFRAPTSFALDAQAKQRFATGMGALNPAFHRAFESALLGQMRAAGIAFTRFDDEVAAQQARKQRGGVAALARGADAVLDVTFDAAGYRPYGREQVLTPEAYVEMDLVNASNQLSIEGAKYSFDRREIVGDPRHMRCESSVTYDSLAKLMNDLPRATKTLESGFMRLADVVAKDVVALARGTALS